MRKTLVLMAIIAAIAACGGPTQNNLPDDTKTDPSVAAAAAEDETKGIGKFSDVQVSPALDKAMAEAGKKIYELKCSACHRLNDEEAGRPRLERGNQAQEG